MRRLALILLLLPLSFSACIETTTALLANNSMQLSPNSCLNITDLDTIINVPDVRQNMAYNLSPSQTMTDPISNNQYTCQYDVLNINQNLNYGGIYYNPQHEIYITCQNKTLINQEINITAGNYYRNEEFNLTVNANHKLININKTLDFLENYSNDDIKLYLRAPEKPQLNVLKELTFSENYINEEYNITVAAPNFPVINEETTLSCGQTKEYSEYGAKVHAQPCLNVDKTLLPGELYQSSEYGISLRASPRIDITQNLDYNETYKNDQYGIYLTCLPRNDEIVQFCNNITDLPLPQIWEMIDFNNTNYTCSAVANNICISDISDYCTLDQKLGGTFGLMQCFNANIEAMQNHSAQCEDDKAKCQSELGRLQGVVNGNSKTSDDMVKVVAYAIAGGLAAATLLAGLYYWIMKQKKEEAPPHG